MSLLLVWKLCLFLERTRDWQIQAVSVVTGGRGSLPSQVQGGSAPLSTGSLVRDLGSSPSRATVDFFFNLCQGPYLLCFLMLLIK